MGQNFIFREAVHVFVKKKMILNALYDDLKIAKTTMRPNLGLFVLRVSQECGSELYCLKQVLFLGWFSCKNLLEKEASGEWKARLVVAPLFETIPDLEVLL